MHTFALGGTAVIVGSAAGITFANLSLDSFILVGGKVKIAGFGSAHLEGSNFRRRDHDESEVCTRGNHNSIIIIIISNKDIPAKFGLTCGLHKRIEW